MFDSHYRRAKIIRGVCGKRMPAGLASIKLMALFTLACHFGQSRPKVKVGNVQAENSLYLGYVVFVVFCGFRPQLLGCFPFLTDFLSSKTAL